MKALFFKTTDGKLINLALAKQIIADSECVYVYMADREPIILKHNSIEDIESFLLKMQGAL